MNDDLPLLDAEALGLSGILGNAFNIMGQNQAAMFGQMQQRTRELEGARDTAFGDLQTQMSQPNPQNDPHAEFYARLAGGISSALAPQMGGQELAEQTIGGAKNDMMQQKLRVQQILATKYEQAAKAADKAGDLETSLKMWKNHQGALETISIAQRHLGNIMDNQARVKAAQIQASAKQKDHLIPQFQAAMTTADKADAEAQQLTELLKDPKLDKKTRKLYTQRALSKQAYAKSVRDAASNFMVKGQWGSIPSNPASVELAKQFMAEVGDNREEDVIHDLYQDPDAQRLMLSSGVTPQEVEPLLRTMLQARTLAAPPEETQPDGRALVDARNQERAAAREAALVADTSLFWKLSGFFGNLPQSPGAFPGWETRK